MNYVNCALIVVVLIIVVMCCCKNTEEEHFRKGPPGWRKKRRQERRAASAAARAKEAKRAKDAATLEAYYLHREQEMQRVADYYSGITKLGFVPSAEMIFKLSGLAGQKMSLEQAREWTEKMKRMTPHQSQQTMIHIQRLIVLEWERGRKEEDLRLESKLKDDYKRAKAAEAEKRQRDSIPVDPSAQELDLIVAARDDLKQYHTDLIARITPAERERMLAQLTPADKEKFRDHWWRSSGK